jgi:hypothetical protein
VVNWSSRDDVDSGVDAGAPGGVLGLVGIQFGVPYEAATPTETAGVGGGEDWEIFETVTLVVAVDVLFEVSYAIAVTICVPFDTWVVFQVVLYIVGPDVAVTSDPRFTPSIWNWTPWMPMTAVDDAIREILPETMALEVGAVRATDGVGFATVTVTYEEVAVFASLSVTNE